MKQKIPYVPQETIVDLVTDRKLFRASKVAGVWFGTRSGTGTDGVYAVTYLTTPLFIYIPSRSLWFGNRDYLQKSINPRSPFTPLSPQTQLLWLSHPHADELRNMDMNRHHNWKSTKGLLQLIQTHRHDKAAPANKREKQYRDAKEAFERLMKLASVDTTLPRVHKAEKALARMRDLDPANPPKTRNSAIQLTNPLPRIIKLPMMTPPAKGMTPPAKGMTPDRRPK